MAKYPLDKDIMFMEFPHLMRGLKSINISSETQIQAICRMMNENIYDYVGIRGAFEKASQKYSEESGEPTHYDRFFEKLERYMTAHLICLYIYDSVQNVDEAPYVTHYSKLISDGLQEGSKRAGNVTSILQASSIGQKILAMLRMNNNNIGGVL